MFVFVLPLEIKYMQTHPAIAKITIEPETMPTRFLKSFTVTPPLPAFTKGSVFVGLVPLLEGDGLGLVFP